MGEEVWFEGGGDGCWEWVEVSKYKWMMIICIKYNIEQMRKLPTCNLLSHGSEGCLNSVDSPLQMKLIKYLGLKKYMIDNFIFKRKPSKYFIRKKQDKNTFFQQTQFQAPPGYTYQTKILEKTGHSVPVLRLIPNNKSNNNVIVYAHGNASDLADSLTFVEKLSQHIETEYVIFDYTGYGQSRTTDVGEEIICQDIQIVLAWVTTIHSINDVILWGFSLGTFPVLHAASKYQVKGVLLQCPIASIACIFHKDLHPDIEFAEDHFSNLKYITKVKSKIFITHSSGDQIIPFSHAKLLFDKFMKKNGLSQITFIEIGKIKHNSLHRYIVSEMENQLQKQVFEFVLNLIYDGVKKPKGKAQSNIKLQKKSHQANTECDEESQLSLKQIRQSLKEAEVDELMADMDEIVIVEDDKKVTTMHRLKAGKGCFCFSGKN